MASIDFGDALEYPLEGEEALKTQLIGGGVPAAIAVVTTFVAFLSIFLAPLALVNLLVLPVQLAISVLWIGFFVEVARRTYDGVEQPPTWSDWEGMARTGLRGFAVTLVYQIPGIVLSVASVVVLFAFFGAAVGVSQSSESGGAALGIVAVLVMAVLIMVTLAYYLVMSYVVPIALCAYAAEDEFGAAFSVETIRRVGLDSDYAVAWVVFAGIYFVAVSVVSGLTAVLVGYLLLPFLPLLYFFLGTAGFHAFGQVYADVMQVESVPAQTPEPN